MYSAFAQTALTMILKDSYAYNLNRMDNNQETISKLKFIGRLKKGDKINTRHLYIQPDSLGTTLSRTFIHQDNRENAVNFCQDTVRKSFELVALFEKSQENGDKLLVHNLLTDLQQSMEGLANLKFTYTSDTMVCCKIDTLLENINVKLENYSKNTFRTLETT